MRIAFILVSTALFFFSCKKSEAPDNNNESISEETEIIEEPVANILLTIFDPPIELTSIDSLVNHPSNCGLIPYPNNSQMGYPFDINDNGTYDFRIVMQTKYHWVSASNPCSNYNYRITLEGTSYRNQITSKPFENLAIFLDKDDTIDSTLNWENRAFLMMRESNVPFQIDFAGDGYVGLKMVDGEDTFYGWILVNKSFFHLYIKSYAINLTVNQPLKAGQVE